MTIKEIEVRTGLPRASIRYYEDEGLLSPKRLPNGYRDYSEEDAAALEKIKLLRQLQLDIGAIRLVQRGELTLSQALFSQLNRLEGDKAAMERAAQVCRDLERSGVEYAALDPAPWLRELSAPARPAVAPPAPPRAPGPSRRWEPEGAACYFPWRRYFARAVDMSLYQLVFYALALGLFRAYWLLEMPQILNFLEGVLLLAFTMAVEPFWLHFWGWTPGKWLFGLKLRSEDGEKLTLAAARERSWAVAWEGYRWNIPIWDQVTMWKCRKEGLDGRNADWDFYSHNRYTVEERPGGAKLGGAAYLIVQVLFFALVASAVLGANLPPERGALTVEQFAENYNYYAQQLNYGVGLDRGGNWQLRQDNSVYVVDTSGLAWDEPEYRVEDGAVTAVTFRVQGGDSVIFLSHARETPALLAMTGALDGLDLFNYDLNGWLEVWNQWNDPGGSFTTDHRGIRVEQTVETRGYDKMGDIAFWADVDSGETPHYERTVTISLIKR